jgi:hypothetical protein
VFTTLAMAHHKLGQDKESLGALATAEDLLAKYGPNLEKGRPFGMDWHDWLRFHVLHREAKALLNQKSGR